MSNTTTFGLIRHAETVWNLEKKIQGHQDSPLSSNGSSMADSWAEILKDRGYNRIITSDLGRAVKTGEIINRVLQIPASKAKCLREMDWGEWTGRVYKEVRKGAPEIMKKQVHSGWGFHPPGGESRRAVAIRSVLGLEKTAEKWPGQRILIVTHEGLIHCLINYLLGRSFLYGEKPILKSYHLHELKHDGNNLLPCSINALNLFQSA